MRRSCHNLLAGWKQVAKLREWFAGCVFSLVEGEEATYWLFVYAKQSPFRLYFLELNEQDGVHAQVATRELR